ARWSGPVTSSFGVHLVRIIDRSPGRAPALSEIRDVVRRDWSEAKARDVRENDYVQRRSRFIIEIERDDDSAPMKTP
ncbi:MAG: peptidylprolyl isomerase, partial [Lysobacterales bacterium]